jgi:hypothetical protein
MGAIVPAGIGHTCAVHSLRFSEHNLCLNMHVCALVCVCGCVSCLHVRVIMSFSVHALLHTKA